MGSHKDRNRKVIRTKQALPVRAYIPTVTKRVEKVQRFANGDISCIGWGDRIDNSVCTVRGIRHPEKCSGCALNL